MPLLPVAVILAMFVALVAVAYFVFASFAFGAGYQPTPRRSVEEMLRLAEVSERDTVYDLGAGTGSIVFRAARVYRARVVAVEVEPVRVLILRVRRALGPFADRIAIVWGDFFRLDFRAASVVTTFLWGRAMDRLRPKLERELPPGARIVSYVHPVPGWTAEVYDPATDVYLYRRPRLPDAGSAATGGR
ncbi:MAG TPA: 50S ribosomal protein L11 methyltransferase [Thermoplasmata archaeon]|nr:50S ribosomal protein L11 methyltransferase [Thermoplasmata archaeon]